MTRRSDTASGAPVGLADGIARLRRAVRRGARIADPDNRLTVAQLELLSCLAEHPAARPGQLARLLHLRPNSVTTLVNALTGDGLIRRTPEPADRRAVTLHITQDGLRAVHAWQAVNSAVVNLAASTLTATQRAALTRAAPAMDALAAAINRLADTAATDPDRRPARHPDNTHDPRTTRGPGRTGATDAATRRTGGSAAERGQVVP